MYESNYCNNYHFLRMKIILLKSGYIRITEREKIDNVIKYLIRMHRNHSIF